MKEFNGPKRHRRVPSMRPLLTTQEFMRVNSISQQTLRSYERTGICEPLARDESGYYKYYALGQSQVVNLAEAMRHDGITLSEIAQHVEQGPAALLTAAQQQCASEIRAVRRRLKAVVHLQRCSSDFSQVRGAKGTYLRYMPQRWMALMPVASGQPAPIQPTPISDDAFLAAYERLSEVVEVVGWSQTLSSGSVFSMSADGRSAARYVYIELASPPMPVISGSHIVDGGCYRSAAPSRCNLPCTGENCSDCARFGRNPTNEEQQTWKHLEREESWRCSCGIPASTLSEPYSAGTWAGYTRDALGCAPEEEPARMADRPRMMPYEVRLPLGVTACEIPAGIYLCSQGTAHTETTLYATMIDALLKLETCDLPDKHNSQAESRSRNLQRSSRQKPGPFVEPFARPRSVGDPSMEGWCAPATDEVMERIRLPRTTALPPQDGFCLITTNEPLALSPEQVPLELQALVYIEAPPPAAVLR